MLSKNLETELNRLNGDKDGLDSVILDLSRNLTPIDGNLDLPTLEAKRDDLKLQLEQLEKDYETKELFRTPNFYKLLLSDLLALMPGLLIIGLAKDIGSDYIGLTDANWITAAALVGYLAMFNAGGRLASGFLADKLGPLNVYRFMYFITILALAVLSFVQVLPLAIIALLIIGVSYGSFLSLVPTITGKLFGHKNFSSNYSLIFQAYGVAALLGIYIKKQVNFEQAFMIAMITAIVGLSVAMTIKENTTTE